MPEAGAEPAGAAPASEPPAAAAGAEAASGHGTLHLPGRRRRRLPRPRAIPAPDAPGEGQSPAPAGVGRTPTPRPLRGYLGRRRRRPGIGVRPALASAAANDAPVPGHEQGGRPPGAPSPPAQRTPRRRRAFGADARRGPSTAANTDRPARRSEAENRSARDRRPPPEGRDDRRSRGGPRGERRNDRRGRRRDDAPKRPEPRLYALESVVDRGFDDLPEDEDGTTRRVHWTILKRSVADQTSGKAMSAVYVLRRDDIDTEFPNLGAARAAVNKTIVHPEKLTMSKAEHAAARKQ
jgi:hypothetical protein